VLKSAKKWLQIGLGFVVLAGIGYFLFKTIEVSFVFLQSVNPTVGAAIIAAVATVILGLYTQYLLKKRQLDDVHREKKIQIYEKFIRMAAAHLAETNQNLKQEKITQDKVVEFFFHLKTDLILRGSARVIKALAKFEAVSAEEGDVLSAVDEIYRAMRKDVGLSNVGLRPKELVGIYLSSDDRAKLIR